MKHKTLLAVAVAIGLVIASGGAASASGSQSGHTTCSAPTHPVVSSNVSVKSVLSFTFDNGAGGVAFNIPAGHSTKGTGDSSVYGTAWTVSTSGTISSAIGSCA